jgi:hypothetical protein
MVQKPAANISVSVKIFDFGHLETHDILGREEIAPQLIEAAKPQYCFPDATAPKDPTVVFPVVAFI